MIPGDTVRAPTSEKPGRKQILREPMSGQPQSKGTHWPQSGKEGTRREQGCDESTK